MRIHLEVDSVMCVWFAENEDQSEGLCWPHLKVNAVEGLWTFELTLFHHTTGVLRWDRLSPAAAVTLQGDRTASCWSQEFELQSWTLCWEMLWCVLGWSGLVWMLSPLEEPEGGLNKRCPHWQSLFLLLRGWSLLWVGAELFWLSINCFSGSSLMWRFAACLCLKLVTP